MCVECSWFMRKQKSIFLACIVAIAAKLSCFTLGAAGSHGHWDAVTVLIVVTQFCVLCPPPRTSLLPCIVCHKVCSESCRGLQLLQWNPRPLIMQQQCVSCHLYFPAARRHVYSCLDLDAGLICSNRHNILLLKATTGIKCSSYSQLLDLSLLIIFHSAYDRLPWSQHTA